MHHPVCCRRPNCLALLILGATTGLGYLAFEPRPAGAHVATPRSVSELARLIPSNPVPSAATAGADGTQVIVGPVVEGKLALMMNLALLKDGLDLLQKSPSYTATFLKQEKIGRKPLDHLQTIEMKLRHEPFSVYMKWLTVKEGQEVLFVEGELNDRMLVKKGGMLSRMPSVKLAPDSPLALNESRHPVTDAGILRLTEKLMKFRTEDLARIEKVKCEFIPGQSIAGRKCYCFDVTYSDPETEPLYRKSLTWIDEELSIPVCVKNYTWENGAQAAEDEEEEEVVEDDESSEAGDMLADAATPEDPTLIEFYTFTDIAFEKQTDPHSFDAANKDYSFKRQ
ncbi:MAG: DUF1571 domain-containing protein [Planctomycetaceae bacterium]|nr:DUF1571 domain-containing protein [Planctomycetaceae bacterium]